MIQVLVSGICRVILWFPRVAEKIVRWVFPVNYGPQVRCSERLAELRNQHDWVMEHVHADEGRDDACIEIDAEIKRLEEAK